MSEPILCDVCAEREVMVRVTQVVDGEPRELKLCERCAAERGIQTSASVAQTPLGGFLNALWKTTDPAVEAPSGGTCPGCGATFAEFRETGRLGCAECYRSFDPQLRLLIRRYHGSTVHHGRRHEPPGGSGPQGAGADLARGLREQLRLAVASENFELAAELRDRLKELSG